MTTEDLNSIEAASVVDARGSACPGPLLEAKKGIGTVKVGEILEILSNDSATKNDIPIWANKVGHESLGHLEADCYDRIFVRRQKYMDGGMAERGSGQKILILATETCAYPGANAVGQAHISYPANTYVFSVRSPVLFPEKFYLDCFA